MTLFWNAPVFGPNRARYTCFWDLPYMLLPCKFPRRSIAPTSTEVDQLRWKLPPNSTEVNILPFTSMEVNLLPFTSMEVAMEVASSSNFIYFHESFHLLPSTSMEVSGIFHGSRQQASFHASSSSFHRSNKSLPIYFHPLPWDLAVGQFPRR